VSQSYKHTGIVIESSLKLSRADRTIIREKSHSKAWISHMREPLRIFIGSSREALAYAKEIQDLLFEEESGTEDEVGIIVKGWWSTGVFRVGETYIESLERVMEETNAAILIASEDDQTTARGKMFTTPRDNLTFESGMAIGVHGRKRTALAIIGSPKLPSDLDGLTNLHLDVGTSGNDFRERNRGSVRKLIDQWKTTIDFQRPTNIGPRNDQDSLPELEPEEEQLSLSVVEVSEADRNEARLLVEEIKNFSAGLLSRTNLIKRYQINRIAVPALCKKMNSSVRASSQPLSVPHLVSVAEYEAFEKQYGWRTLGYNVQRVFEADDGTQTLSGVSEKQIVELIQGAGTSPYESRIGDRLASNEPVRSVSWFDAVAYCLSVNGRLPTSGELTDRSVGKRQKDIWEWTQSWFTESAGHIAVNRSHRRPIGVNPDLRLPNLGFRVFPVR
jgi:predicted nucleotide-binding protein